MSFYVIKIWRYGLLLILMVDFIRLNNCLPIYSPFKCYIMVCCILLIVHLSHLNSCFAYLNDHFVWIMAKQVWPAVFLLEFRIILTLYARQYFLVIFSSLNWLIESSHGAELSICEVYANVLACWLLKDVSGGFGNTVLWAKGTCGAFVLLSAHVVKTDGYTKASIGKIVENLSKLIISISMADV